MNHGSPLDDKIETSHLGHTLKGAYKTPCKSISIT